MKAIGVFLMLVSVAGCASRPTRAECEFARGEVNAADACRADSACSARGFTFPQVEAERATLGRCRA